LFYTNNDNSNIKFYKGYFSNDGNIVWKRTYGSDFLQFPDEWTSCGIESSFIGGVDILANGDSVLKVTFRNSYPYLPPMVIPIVYSTSGNWYYVTTMIANLNNTDCNLCIHNLQNTKITVQVGYIAIG